MKRDDADSGAFWEVVPKSKAGSVVELRSRSPHGSLNLARIGKTLISEHIASKGASLTLLHIE